MVGKWNEKSDGIEFIMDSNNTVVEYSLDGSVLSLGSDEWISEWEYVPDTISEFGWSFELPEGCKFQDPDFDFVKCNDGYCLEGISTYNYSNDNIIRSRYYEYDDQNRISKETLYDDYYFVDYSSYEGWIYDYDANGCLASKKHIYYDEDSSTDAETTYYYYKFDSDGKVLCVMEAEKEYYGMTSRVYEYDQKGRLISTVGGLFNLKHLYENNHLDEIFVSTDYEYYKVRYLYDDQGFCTRRICEDKNEYDEISYVALKDL